MAQCEWAQQQDDRERGGEETDRRDGSAHADQAQHCGEHRAQGERREVKAVRVYLPYGERSRYNHPQNP